MRALLTLLCCLSASPTVALTVIEPIPVHGPRCEAEFGHGTIGPVEQVGNSKLIQRVTERRQGQHPVGGFVFADCKNGQAALIGEVSSRSGEPDPYRITATTTVDALIRLSNERGDPSSRRDGAPDQPVSGRLTNIYCGCRVLYPGSLAAAWAQ